MRTILPSSLHLPANPYDLFLQVGFGFINRSQLYPFEKPTFPYALPKKKKIKNQIRNYSTTLGFFVYPFFFSFFIYRNRQIKRWKEILRNLPYDFKCNIKYIEVEWISFQTFPFRDADKNNKYDNIRKLRKYDIFCKLSSFFLFPWKIFSILFNSFYG